MKKKVLIVGGLGFIGHNLAVKLKKENYEVFIVDSLSVNNFLSVLNNKDLIPNPSLSKYILEERIKIIKKHKIDYFIQDARMYHEMSNLFTKIKPEIVIHLAAVSHSNRSNKDPYSTFDHSLRTLENSLDISRGNIKHFIYFSSSMVYGNFKTNIVNENDICDPIGIYGALKFSGEKMVIAYNQVFNLPYTIIRPSALYGERCISRRVGQVFIENLLDKKKIIINGTGNERLDFTYIEDLNQGVIDVIKKKNSLNQIFNLTYGSSRPINDLILLLKKNFKKINVQRVKKEFLMPERGTLSTEKARDLIKYKPKWPIEKGYIKYINWYKDFYKDYKNSK